MSNAIAIVTILSEILAIIICLHAFFEKKVNFDGYLCGTVWVSCAILCLANMAVLPRFCVIAVYILLWCFCYFRFKRPFWYTTKRYFAGIAMCVIIEILLSLCNILLQTFVDIHILALVSSIVLLFIVCAIGAKIAPKVKILDYGHDLHIQYAVIFYVIILIAVTIDYIFMRTPLRVSTISVIICISIGYLYILRLIHTKLEMEKNKLEMELHKIYGKTYSELMLMVRKRQHDFKNQLGAIYSMHITATSLEELVAMQKEYGDNLMENNRYDGILTNCDNPILAGYLYQRFLCCENMGVIVDFDIHVGQAECTFPLHEMIEILGILIDNACESLTESEADNKVIKVMLNEKTNSMELSVANPSREMLCSEIERMFVNGVSTKGENRGIGLARLREIAQMRDTHIAVDNYTESNRNWLCFRLKIQK